MSWKNCRRMNSTSIRPSTRLPAADVSQYSICPRRASHLTLMVFRCSAGAPTPPRRRARQFRRISMRELTDRHGEHPTWDKDHCALWDEQAMAWMKSGLETGIERRAAICRDLLRREPWDLFITYFGETHSAGHFFYHLSQPHPMPRSVSQRGDWLLEVFQAVDRAVGTIIDAAPPGCAVRALFRSRDGGQQYRLAKPRLPTRITVSLELPRSVWAGAGDLTACRLRLLPAGKRPWPHEVWALKHDRNPSRERCGIVCLWSSSTTPSSVVSGSIAMKYHCVRMTVLSATSRRCGIRRHGQR